MEQLMVRVRAFTLVHILLSLWVPCVKAETNPSVLAATLSSIPSSSNSALNLRVGSPAQNLPFLFDLQVSITSLTCSPSSATNSSATSFFNPSLSSTFHNLSADSSGAAACTSAEDRVNSLYIERTAFGDPLLLTNISGVDFQCCTAPPPYANVAGVAGFGNGNLSLPSQISKNGGLARQFAYCWPSIVFFGRATSYAYLNPFPGQMQPFTVSARTRLYYVKNPNPLTSSSGGGGGGGGYAISLQSIGVGGNVTVLQKAIKLRISTTEPFTKLERSLYIAVRAQFRQAIGYGSTVKKMAAVAPFDTCFDSAPLYYAAQGPHLKSPGMALSLEGGAVWGMLPHNTFIGSSSGATCLAILNAGAGRPSVLGTFQQTDALLEFDLQHSQFAFQTLFDPYTIHPETPGCGDVSYPMYYNP